MSPSINAKKHLLPCALLIALGLGLTACNKEEAPATEAATDTAAQTDAQIAKAAQAAQAAEAALAALPVEELRKRASTAFREQRLYAPAGDNAMEYYLALRKKSDKPDANSESALMDLMPYTVIAAEQAIGRYDFVEAERLRALLERADPQAPALPRIAEAISTGKANAAQRVVDDAKRTEEEKRLADLAKQKALDDAAKAAAAVKTAPTTTAAPAAETRAPAPVVTAPAPVVSAPANNPPPVSAPVRPAPSTSSALVAISTPQPAYPAEAIRGGITGSVEVEFLVNRDGSVSDVKVIKSNPRGTFDRGVQTTVRKWQFQPLDEPRTVRRNFNFN
ncbi:MAG TPA: energy transducer TonB [Arenimonas sp.]|jgi:protein TonB|nr:energy transducer TonB [Arenimonas sp.]